MLEKIEKIAEAVASKLSKANEIKCTVYNEVDPNYLVAYFYGDFKRDKFKKLKSLIEKEMSTEDIAVNLEFPKTVLDGTVLKKSEDMILVTISEITD